MATTIALTSGEPAGIGPDIIAKVATLDLGVALVYIGDPDLLLQRGKMLGIRLRLKDPDRLSLNKTKNGELFCIPEKLINRSIPGILDIANSSYVINCINRAYEGVSSKYFDAIVTPPVNKAAIIDAGIDFSGHTEHLAKLAKVANPVMLLAYKKLRVALMTTHIPLTAVPKAITKHKIIEKVTIINEELKRKFSIARPKIAILGLNPHAGENGKIGTEEKTSIEPAINILKSNNINVFGPLPADTAFSDPFRKYDVILAMYHDQGLPVIKSKGFGDCVNITLGLPFIRTSVDHGTALTLAGTSLAEADSLVAAITVADELYKTTKNSPYQSDKCNALG